MRSLWLLLAVGLCAGCGSERVPTTKYYKLDIPPAPTPPGPSAPVSLRIEPLRAASLVRQNRIVYRPSPVEVGFYEYHRWAEAPNDTVTRALADQLMRRRVFQSVRVSDAGEKADLVLRGSIDRLQEVDYKGVVRVQVSISAELQDPVQGQTIWSSAASSECVVTKRDVPGVVTAMGQAAQQSITRLISDVTKYVQVKGLAPVSANETPAR